MGWLTGGPTTDSWPRRLGKPHRQRIAGPEAKQGFAGHGSPATNYRLDGAIGASPARCGVHSESSKLRALPADADHRLRIRPAQRLSRCLAAERRDAADEGRLEASGSTMVCSVIVSEGKVVRPSQLIASVRPTKQGAGGGAR